MSNLKHVSCIRIERDLLIRQNNHGVSGSFAVAYDIIRRNPEMLKPVLDSPGNHEMTYHLHPQWDLQLERDFGGPLSSSFLAFYDIKTLNRLFSLAEEAFNKVYGYVPIISFLGNVSISTPMVNLLEIVCGQFSGGQVFYIDKRGVSLNSRSEDNDLLIHRVNVSPAFKEPFLDSDGSLIMENPNEGIKLRINTTATGYETVKNPDYTGLRLFFERPGEPIHTGTPIHASTSALYETELFFEC